MNATSPASAPKPRRAFLAFGHRIPREGTMLVDLSHAPKRHRVTFEERAALLNEWSYGRRGG